MKFHIKTIAFLLIILPSTLSAQSLLTDGMEWYYTVTSFWGPEEIPNHCYIDGDIEVGGKDCKIYHREVETCNQRYEPMEYFYEEDQKIFFYDFDTETFKLLYDYSMETGDTLAMPLWNGMQFENDSGNIDSLYYMTVDSVNFITLNNQEFKRYFVRYDRWNDTEIDFSNYEPGVIVEYLGNLTDYFHFRENGLCDDKYNEEIRCFDHPDYGLIQLSQVACDSVLTDTQEEIIAADLHIYPNPASDKVLIEMVDGNVQDLQVFNLNGQEIEKTFIQSIDNQIIEIGLTQFANGIYYLKIATSKGTVTKRMVVKK